MNKKDFALLLCSTVEQLLFLNPANTMGSPQEKLKAKRLGGVCDHINHFGYHIKEIWIEKAWGLLC